MVVAQLQTLPTLAAQLPQHHWLRLVLMVLMVLVLMVLGLVLGLWLRSCFLVFACAAQDVAACRACDGGGTRVTLGLGNCLRGRETTRSLVPDLGCLTPI